MKSICSIFLIKSGAYKPVESTHPLYFPPAALRRPTGLMIQALHGVQERKHTEIILHLSDIKHVCLFVCWS